MALCRLRMASDSFCGLINVHSLSFLQFALLQLTTIHVFLQEFHKGIGQLSSNAALR